MKDALPPKLKKFSAAKQRRLDEVLDKNAEGTATPRERTRLGRLVAEAEQLTVSNSRLLAGFTGAPGASVPPVP